MQDVSENINDCNIDKDRKILIVFDDMNLIVAELFIRSRKLNISLVFTTQSYFKLPKDVRMDAIHLFIMKISNKRELQQIAINHSSDIEIYKIYKKCTNEPSSLLVNDTTFASENPLRFTKKILNI